MKALVTGASGMLADSLIPLLSIKGYHILATDLTNLSADIELMDVRDSRQVDAYIKKNLPDIVFHLAAETNVDKCELEPEQAFNSNVKGTENIAFACKKNSIPMIYISTGAVFDGENKEGYTEADIPIPLSIYGKTKYQGEKIVQSLLKNYFIVRAGWMIGGYNKDKKFVWKIIQLMKKHKEIPVVIDKRGSPTFTKDFAQGILDIVSNNKPGIYHCVNEGACTRFDLAQKIKEYLGLEDIVLKPVCSDAFPLPAPRGKSEAMLNKKISEMGIKMRHWHLALKEYISEIRQR